MKVWSLLGHRVGDNAQVLALTKATGWPSETKKLVWKSPLPIWTPRYGRQIGLKHLAHDAKQELTEPWPDLVISVGWRSVPVARWIQQQSGAKLVQIGRPRAPLKYFDLVITTPQYRLPAAQNILKLSGPIMPPRADQPTKDLDKWREKLAPLARPWIAVLIGGNSPPINVSPDSISDLAAKCNELAQARSGSLLITTGPRTPAWALDLFLTQVSVPHFHRGWTATGDNPYSTFLAVSDAFVVTNDSISMAQEAASTHKPLFLYNFPKENSLLKLAQQILDPLTCDRDSWSAAMVNRLVASGMIVLPRFPEDYHAGLIGENRMAILGATKNFETQQESRKEAGKADEAVRALFADS